MGEQDAEKAAEDAVDQERLMEGEHPHTRYPDDIRHWRQVYSELLAFKHELLDRTRARVEQMTESARLEVEQTDLPVLLAEEARLRRRLEFWTRRNEELDSAASPAG